MKRARQPHQKEERREAILAAARATLGETPYPEITMSQVAARTGLAKGTLYLYFTTKEELFLEVFRGEFHAWLWDLEGGLDGLPRNGRIAAFARLVAGSLAARPAFRILLGMLPAVLEQNLPEATALDFGRERLAQTQAMGAHLERHLDFLEAGEGARLLMRIHALAVGLQALADPPPPARGRLTHPDLAPARLDFAQEARTCLQDLLRGMRERPHGSNTT